VKALFQGSVPKALRAVFPNINLVTSKFTSMFQKQKQRGLGGRIKTRKWPTTRRPHPFFLSPLKGAIYNRKFMGQALHLWKDVNNRLLQDSNLRSLKELFSSQSVYHLPKVSFFMRKLVRICGRVYEVKSGDNIWR
jgi:hypothetical protein